MNKEMRREQRAAEKETRSPGVAGEDPDIAGIVPGPQPHPFLTEEEIEEEKQES